MRILFVGNLELGEVVDAPSKVGLEVFNRTINKYETVKFFVYFQDGTKYSRFKKLFGKEIINENIIMFGLIPFLFNIIKLRPEIVQITSISLYYTIALPLLKILGSRIYFTVHNVNKYTLYKYSNIHKKEKQRILLSEKLSIFYSSQILLFSMTEKKHLLANYKIAESNVNIIENGINILNIRKKYTTNSDILKIITVGSLERKEKGLENLIKFLDEMRISIQLTICHYKKSINIFPESLNSLKIIWKEPLTEIQLREEFINNDFFISFSEYESFGIALIEAMNSGLLFLATDTIGLIERFDQELEQFVIPFGDWGMAKNKLNYLINLPIREKNDLSEKIIKFSNQYTWDNVVQKYFKLYESV